MKLTKYIIILLTTFLFCGSLIAQNFKTIFPFKDKRGKWGYCDVNNKVIVEPSFEFAELHQNGFAKVINDKDEQAVINDKGEYIIPFGEYLISTGKNEAVFNQDIGGSKEEAIQNIYGIGLAEETNKVEVEDEIEGFKDNVFVVMKEKERDWYNGKGELLFNDKFDYDLTISNVVIDENNEIHFYILKNEIDEKISIINSDGELIVKDVKAFGYELLQIVMDEKIYPYFTFYKGDIKADVGENEDHYLGMYTEYLHGYSYSPYRTNVSTRENIKCMLTDATGKVLIPYSRGLVAIEKYKSNMYYHDQLEQGFLTLIELVSENDDCEPTEQYGLYGLGSNKEVVPPTFDQINFLENVYERQNYNAFSNEAEEKIVLKVINSNEKFNEFNDFVGHVDALIDKELLGDIDENASEEYDGFKGTFAVFTEDEKTIFYEIKKDRAELFKQLDEPLDLREMYFQNGMFYANYTNDYKYRYNISSGKKELYSTYDATDEESLKGEKLELVQVEEGLYNIKNNKGKSLTNDFISYEFYNEDKKIIIAHDGYKYALVDLNKKQNIEFKYHAFIKPEPGYNEIGYTNEPNNLYYTILEMADQMGISRTELGEILQELNLENKNDENASRIIYPQIVVTDEGFGVVNEKAEFIVPIQDKVLIFENFGDSKIIGVFSLVASVVKDKKNVGYYGLDGTKYFD